MSSQKKAKRTVRAETATLAKRSMKSPTELIVAMRSAFSTTMANAFCAAEQNETPSMAIMVYALAFMNNMNFSKQYMQHMHILLQYSATEPPGAALNLHKNVSTHNYKMPKKKQQQQILLLLGLEKHENVARESDERDQE